MKLSLTEFPEFIKSKSFPSLAKGVFLFGSLLSAQWFLSELVHFPMGGTGLCLAGVGVFWITRANKNTFDSPKTVKGWIKRCEKVLDDFSDLESKDNYFENKITRELELAKILKRSAPLRIACVGAEGSQYIGKDDIRKSLKSKKEFELNCYPSLSIKDSSWQWPESLHEEDFVIYFLPIPLRASDLLWIREIPSSQHCRLICPIEESPNQPEILRQLHAQLPDRWTNKIIFWSEKEIDKTASMIGISREISNSEKIIESTRQRMLSSLHLKWQNDLEKLRRERFRGLQNRSQWVVASAVFASPVPSTDLLVMSVVNGMMMKEMAKIWSCKLSPDALTAMTKQLAGAAIAQGIVEWSGQALLSVSKIHGSTWLAAGTLQALSSAYLTRVVGRSMADWMAINNGIEQPDLEAFKVQIPTLISHAMKEEKLDWPSFLKQAKDWRPQNELKVLPA
tara:strand:- start:724 stop:2079 length:1356 start_codon:yes stop_codon:yes gene_type:complete